ncbi:hypothetical protein OXPF_39660 [Oxobacter pfennigii]|uniref:Uncharacterized protein n=1 Tax=Oxobacter pfennigii TaxID=36849 RepID=A0A0P8W1A7_9CLOT|nr:hypothetical protein [Oxobacter pfennigii]KPU42187.1 hypothetical protein OXPF_39660 [Oxobacter pfennigii]
MTARCTCCKKHWNISIYQQVPKSGYVCPRCRSRKKESVKGGDKVEWVNVDHAVLYILRSFSGESLVKALVRLLGKKTVQEIVDKCEAVI